MFILSFVIKLDVVGQTKVIRWVVGTGTPHLGVQEALVLQVDWVQVLYHMHVALWKVVLGKEHVVNSALLPACGFPELVCGEGWVVFYLILAQVLFLLQL